MASEIKAPYLTHEQIRTRAKLFLEKYHPEDSYPVPIEDIIEYQLKLDIIPIPGLRDYVEVEGFLSVVSRSISIDDYIYHKRPARCRFTLAHEIGHLVLHRQIYKQFKFDTMSECKKITDSIPDKEYRLLEWHAHVFAGLTLVPCHHLMKRYEHHKKHIKSLNIQNEDIIFDQTVELLAEDFFVSREVIRKRIEKLYPNV